MHTADDENYQRGYEWWLMVEAKKVRHIGCYKYCHYNCTTEESKHQTLWPVLGIPCMGMYIVVKYKMSFVIQI